MLKEIEITQFDFDNETLENEIYKLAKYVKEFFPKNAYMISNIGGDQVHFSKSLQNVLNKKEWPYLFLFHEKIEQYCTKKYKHLSYIYMWMNINYPMSYNSVHNHGLENHLSSLCYYVKTPELSGNIIFIDNDRKKIIEVRENLLIEFLPNLNHAVEPNFSNENRISIAINVCK